MSNDKELPLEIGNSTKEKTSIQTIEGVLERVAKQDPKAAIEIGEYLAIQQTTHQGPMPSPDDLRQYSLTQSDLPERMMKMAENSQANKAKHHSKILELNDHDRGCHHPGK